MKAAEYAAKFLQDRKENQIGAVQKLVVSLMEEMLKLAELRHAKSSGAWFSLITEFDQKWHAICELCPELRKKGFMEGLREHDELGPWLSHVEKVMKGRATFRR